MYAMPPDADVSAHNSTQQIRVSTIGGLLRPSSNNVAIQQPHRPLYNSKAASEYVFNTQPQLLH
eukprot:1117643-Amphidinium_carterae.1